MSYYTYVLEKYDVSDCKTFEDVKSKFPDTSPTFLRKVLFLKSVRITKEGELRGTSKEMMLVRRGPSNRRRFMSPLRPESSKKQKRYPKVNCPQCGKEVFLVYPNDPFCSSKCRKEYRKMHEHMKIKGDNLEELRKLERSLKRRIELTGGLIESQTKHLKKLIQDYYRVCARMIERLESISEKDKKSRIRNLRKESNIKRLRKDSRIKYLRARDSY